MSNQDICVIAKVKISVERHDELPIDFSVKDGMRCRILFNDDSHPAEIISSTVPINIGQSGEVEIKFVSLESERNLIASGLEFEMVGGIKLFGRGVLMEVLSID